MIMPSITTTSLCVSTGDTVGLTVGAVKTGFRDLNAGFALLLTDGTAVEGVCDGVNVGCNVWCVGFIVGRAVGTDDGLDVG